MPKVTDIPVNKSTDPEGKITPQKAIACILPMKKLKGQKKRGIYLIQFRSVKANGSHWCLVKAAASFLLIGEVMV